MYIKCNLKTRKGFFIDLFRDVMIKPPSKLKCCPSFPIGKKCYCIHQCVCTGGCFLSVWMSLYQYSLEKIHISWTVWSIGTRFGMRVDVGSQIGGKWALDLHFTLLLIPFSMLILPFLLGCFKYTSLRYGHLNTTSESWKEKEVWSLLSVYYTSWRFGHLNTTLVFHGRNRGALEVHNFITLLLHVRDMA